MCCSVKRVYTSSRIVWASMETRTCLWRPDLACACSQAQPRILWHLKDWQAYCSLSSCGVEHISSGAIDGLWSTKSYTTINLEIFKVPQVPELFLLHGSYGLSGYSAQKPAQCTSYPQLILALTCQRCMDGSTTRAKCQDCPGKAILMQPFPVTPQTLWKHLCTSYS